MPKTCTCSPRGGACAEYSAYFAERERILGNVAQIAATVVTEADEVASAAPGVCLCGAPTPKGVACGGCAV